MADGNSTSAMKIRTRSCKHCGAEFSYPISRGTDRSFCSDFCRSRVRAAKLKARPLCVVEGCGNPRQYSDGVCNSHYYRRKRTGTIETRLYAMRSLHSNGYIKVKDKGHPLADSGGYVMEHRKVVYDLIGGGDQPCHWCGITVHWKAGALKKGESRLRLIVDHLDGDKTNNQASNLVPACNHCNANRGLFMNWVIKHKDDPVLWKMYQQAKA